MDRGALAGKGADRRSVLAMVLRRAFAQVGEGAALGIPAAIGGGYLTASQLFGVAPWAAVRCSWLRCRSRWPH